MPFRVVLLAVLLMTHQAAPSWGEEPLFPFVVSYDSPENVTNVSAWLGGPAGASGFVRAEGGHLATGAGPIRFWATNLCFDACFPSHEQAEQLAARLARLGFNCVRMHHMDSRSIWGASRDKLTIDPERLELLDYLIYQLKSRGIYTNINLHVSRSLGDAEGFPGQLERPKYDKGLGNFEPRMIELQKKYARDLLAHVNPYTKTAYTDEPAIAFVEISNEDALFAEWARGSIDALAEPYSTTFRGLWNEWLDKKYGSTEQVRKAWSTGASPLGEEMLDKAGIPSALVAPWHLQRDAAARAEWAVEENGPGGKRSLKLSIDSKGRDSWIPQLLRSGLTVRAAEPYTLSFRLRANRAGQIGVNCGMSHAPWSRLGLSANVKTGTEWKDYSFTFIADRDETDARITFTNFEPGTYELSDISLRPGGIEGLASGESLSGPGVPVLMRSDMNRTQVARNDFVDFLWDTEHRYWLGMYRFLKDELRVRSLVSGTQLSYSPPHIQAKLDYIDAHSYWNHPSFQGRPWDRNDWFVRNRALVNSPGGTLASLAARRIDSMAYTVSEYNHPAPNSYAAEGFPMIAAFGSFQGWDGVFPFTYSHNTEFQPRKITGYFDVKSDTAKLVHMPACAALFLRGDVEPARQTVPVPMSLESERRKICETLTGRTLTADQFGLDPRLSLMHAVNLDLTGQAAPAPPALDDDVTQFVSDTGQLRWDVSEPGAGYFIVDTPNTKLFTGFVRGRTFSLGDISLSIGPTQLDWATVSMVSVDRSGFDAPCRILIAATGLLQNKGAKLENLGEERVTLRAHWGDEPILCEGIPASITLPVPAGRVTLYPLDESGNRRDAVPITTHDGIATVSLAPAHKTLWYELVIP